jgi:hypothetical protein
MAKSFGGVGLVPVVTSNQGNSPSGYFDADRVIFSLNGGTTTADLSDLRRNIVTTAGTYTFSFWVKSFDGSSSYNMVVRDINGIANPMQVDGSWKRYTLTATTYPTGVSVIGLGIRGGQSPTNPNIADILIWGFQLEEGAYASSYIPTLSTSVTRLADAARKTNISSLIGQTEGTVFLELASIADLTGYAGVDDGGTPNRVILYGVDDGKIYTQVRVGATVLFQIGSDVIAGPVKAAIAYNASGSVFYVNGVEVGTGTGATFTTLSQFTLTHASQVGSIVKQALVFKTKLTPAQLAELTTL